MSKPETGTVSIHGREYKTVALRVAEFREKHSDFALLTEPLQFEGDLVIFKASILDANGRVLATGHAEERRASSQINRTSALENCETSAIGRALAAFGFGGSEFASAEEVANAIHQQQRETPPKEQPQKNGPQTADDVAYINECIMKNDATALRFSIKGWDRARVNRSWKKLTKDQQKWVEDAMRDD